MQNILIANLAVVDLAPCNYKPAILLHMPCVEGQLAPKKESGYYQPQCRSAVCEFEPCLHARHDDK